jgi:glucan-binding YG repeat protein
MAVLVCIALLLIPVNVVYADETQADSENATVTSIEWNSKHPGKITWDSVSDATRYEVVLYYYTDNGNLKTAHSMRTTKCNADLCEYLNSKKVAGKSAYVEVTAKKNNQTIATGESIAFEDAEFKTSDSFWNKYYEIYDEYYSEYDNDNWVIFAYYYDKNHNNESYLNGSSSSESSSGVYYRPGSNQSSSNKVLTGWQFISNKWYYYNSKGEKQYGGWIKDSGKWYYLNKDGVMQTGWLNLGSDTYYLNSSGDMLTGWSYIGKKWYYFYPDTSREGKMAKNAWVPDKNGSYYYMNSDGSQALGWVNSGGDYYYVDPTTCRYKGGWVDNNQFYCDPITGKWIKNYGIN